MDTTNDFGVVAGKLLTKIINNHVPGQVIDLEPLGRFEILPDRKLLFYRYDTGKTEIWSMPDGPNGRIADMKLADIPVQG